MKTLDPDSLAKARALIRIGALREAIKLHRSVFPAYNDPLFPDLSEADLRECLTTPLPVFSFCTDDELRELRQSMALGLIAGNSGTELVGGASWQHRMSVKAVYQNFWMSVMNYRNISEWRRSGLVVTARIVNSGDGGCPACQELTRRDHLLAEFPGLPFHACENLNTVGCRCVAIAGRIKGITR